MTFVITQNCCNDASCVPVCPVDCIRPAPTATDPRASMLYIDPQTCVDCGACVDVCPVGAIYYEDELPASQQAFLDINAGYFAENPLQLRPIDHKTPPRSVEPDTLRVAIVGTGPAACYAAVELSRTAGVQVSMFDRLPTPFGLVRAGVAPDHQHTKDVTSVFSSALASPDVRCLFNVDVGEDLSHEELREHHHAIIYAVGASTSRSLGIPGENLPGSVAAADFVAWYNGHPEHASDEFDLGARRVVVVGNGNVALDVARVLLTRSADLSTTDIAAHALAALDDSHVEEVLILGRRGAGDAAFSFGEFLALKAIPDVDVIVKGPLGDRPEGDFEAALKYDALLECSRQEPQAGLKRLVFRFGATPVELIGSEAVEGLRVHTSGRGDDRAEDEIIDATLVLRSIGYHGSAVPGIPFDAGRGVVPNEAGRVLDGDGPLAGVYVTGWIKRGPRGVIGTNRGCALETVTAMLEDFEGGVLTTPTTRASEFDALLDQRGIEAVDWSGWQRIDSTERSRGHEQSRPREKLVTIDELLVAARE